MHFIDFHRSLYYTAAFLQIETVLHGVKQQIKPSIKSIMYFPANIENVGLEL